MLEKLEVTVENPKLEFKCQMDRCIKAARQIGVPDTDICLELLEQVRLLTVRETLRLSGSPQ